MTQIQLKIQTACFIIFGFALININDAHAKAGVTCLKQPWVDVDSIAHILKRYPDLTQKEKASLFAIIPCLKNIDQLGNDGNALIHWAALRGWTEMLAFLLERRADPNIKSINGDTSPLFGAASARNPYNVVKILLKHGANPNQNAADGTSPLMAAVSDARTVKLLVDYGAIVNWKNNTESSPILSAVAYGNFDSINNLVKAGADINVKDNKGNSLVHVAVDTFCCRAKTKNLLISYLEKIGLDVDSTNNYGFTPLGRSLITHQYEVAEKLIELGAKCLPENKSNISPIKIIEEWYPGAAQDSFFKLCSKY